MSKQRILIVDDHEVVRLGLKSLLDRHPQFEVLGLHIAKVDDYISKPFRPQELVDSIDRVLATQS